MGTYGGTIEAFDGTKVLGSVRAGLHMIESSGAPRWVGEFTLPSSARLHGWIVDAHAAGATLRIRTVAGRTGELSIQSIVKEGTYEPWRIPVIGIGSPPFD